MVVWVGGGEARAPEDALVKVQGLGASAVEGEALRG